MILNPSPWLSDTQCMQDHPDLSEKHCEKYSDTNYDILFDRGEQFDTDVYVIPVSGKFSTPISHIPDDYYYQIPDDIINRIMGGTCKLLWDMTFEMYNPDVMSWLRHNRGEPWAHRSWDFIQNTQRHYGLTKSNTMLALNNHTWRHHECDYTQPITINKCDAWYYPDTDPDYITDQLRRYQIGQDFNKKFITTLGEIRQHKNHLAKKIHHCDTHWHASARTNYWEPKINSELGLPWILDHHSDPVAKDHYRPLGPDLLRYMSQSQIDVVCDTIMMSSPLTPDSQTTEKPFRSICMLKPMLYLGQPGGLAYLRDLGFETFSDFWDESYDSEPDPVVRYRMVCDIINEIQTDAHPGLKLQGVEKILIHNYEHYQKLLKSKYQLRYL